MTSRECELAWAAGLFEGEGCFSPRRPSGRSSMHLYAGLSMADEDVVRRFAEVIGFGHIQYQERKQRPRHSPTWRWFVNGADVERLYDLLCLWLGERRKARYAELLAERRTYESQHRYENRRRGTLAAQRNRDPITGRFAFTQGRLP